MDPADTFAAPAATSTNTMLHEPFRPSVTYLPT
jgi:hypothetical protein